MRVEVDGRTYFVEWRYELPTPETNPPAMHIYGNDWNGGATCLIRDGDSPSPGDASFPVIATGTALRSRKDPWSKSIGRRVSFHRAVSNLAERLYPKVSSGGVPVRSVGRVPQAVALCTVFWEAFLNRSGRTTPDMASLAVHQWLLGVVRSERPVRAIALDSRTDGLDPQTAQRMIERWHERVEELGEILQQAARGRIHKAIRPKSSTAKA